MSSAMVSVYIAALHLKAWSMFVKLFYSYYFCNMQNKYCMWDVYVEYLDDYTSNNAKCFTFMSSVVNGKKEKKIKFELLLQSRTTFFDWPKEEVIKTANINDLTYIKLCIAFVIFVILAFLFLYPQMKFALSLVYVFADLLMSGLKMERYVI